MAKWIWFGLAAGLAAMAPVAHAQDAAALYQQILNDPGNADLNLRYARMVEATEPRMALAAYERVLQDNPGNSDAAMGRQRMLRALQPATTQFQLAIGAGWESNPLLQPGGSDSEGLFLASLSMLDERSAGSSMSWRTAGLASGRLVTSTSQLNYGFLGLSTGPVFDIAPDWAVHTSVGGAVTFFNHHWLYKELNGNLTLEDAQLGAYRSVRLRVGYRDYAPQFVSDDGIYLEAVGRFSFSGLFGDKGLFILSPWVRWSNIDGNVVLTPTTDNEPGRYTEIGGSGGLYVTVAEDIVLGGDVRLHYRAYRDQTIFGDDRHEFQVTPGAEVTFQNVFFQSDVQLNYRHRINNSNDNARDFDDDVFTVTFKTRF